VSSSTAAPLTAAPLTEELPSPPLSFAIRYKGGVRVYADAEQASPSVQLELSGASLEQIAYSSDGSVFGVVDAELGVRLFDATALPYRELRTLARVGVQALAFSPRGSFALTWERVAAARGEPDNLIVWAVATGAVVRRFTQKTFSKLQWPTIQWSSDEAIAARMVSSEIHFFDGDQLSTIVNRITLTNVSQFLLAPGGSGANQLVATFSPEKGGAAAHCRVFQYPACDEPINQKSFFGAQDVSFYWSPRGTQLLVVSHAEVDSSGASYYGIERLYMLGGYKNGTSQEVSLPEEGSVFAVAWQHDSKSFAVVHGKMPPRTTIFNLKCAPIADLGQGANNTLVYSPSGKVLLLGGFGNLPGDMAFWEPDKLKLYGRATHFCSSVQHFAPNSRLLLSAALSPRIRVDNCFKVFTYTGKLVSDVPIPELYDAQWRPALKGVYQNQRHSATLIEPADFSKLAGSAAAPGAAAPPKRAAYVPPALRNKDGGSKSTALASSVTAQLRAGQTTAVVRHTPTPAPAPAPAPAAPAVVRLVGDSDAPSKAAKKKGGASAPAAAAAPAKPAFTMKEPTFD
jgi:translation initiation factor 2A